ncbi:ROK family protein [Cnuibacter physcomitrellae]|uniref:ROK family protein n=1 Tax=Cnuibacter physcomitrellae TaxID=1619308 RepID=UPI00217601FE|nr:ROK family protein [Cnuibacter physcomitrellae]MCS5499282.1 ROK family protein [Cnuibacter physcomitrellae]
MRLGLDIGGTKTDAVVLDDGGALAHRLRAATGLGADAVVATAVTLIERIASEAGLGPASFDSIGVGIPGQVDTATGHVWHAVNLGVDELDFGGRVSERIGVPVSVENDVKAAALGAYHLLPGRQQERSMAYLNLGTGLAAGLVIDGRLWRGARGAAGEIGHIPVDPQGVLCPCGQRGCLETVASGSAIARQWPSDDPIPIRSLLAAAEAGDGAAQRIRDSFVDNVAAAVRVLVLTLDVDTVTIGGGLSALGDWLLDSVREVLGRWAADSAFLASLGLSDRVRVVPAGFPAAAVGAALVGAGTSHPVVSLGEQRDERVVSWLK